MNDIITSITTWCNNIINKLGSTAYDITCNITDMATYIATMSTDIIRNMANNIASIIMNINNAVTDVINNAVKVSRDLTNQIINTGANIVSNIIQTANSIITGLLDGIKNLFVPKSSDIESSINNVKTVFNNKFGLSAENLKVTGSKSKQLDNDKFKDKIKIGNKEFNLSFVNTDLINNGVSKFKPLIRGFVVFMLLIFNLNQILALIDVAPITLGAWVNYQNSVNGNTGGKNK